MQPGDVSHALIQQGEKEKLGKTPPSSSTTAWWWWRSAELQQGFAKHYERRGGREVGLRQEGEQIMCWAAPIPQVYIGEEEGLRPHLGFPPQGWRQPPDPIWVAARRREGGGAPRVGLRAHLP